MPLDGLCLRHATYRRDQLAVVCGNERLTHRELNDRVNRAANAMLELGLRKGDRIAIFLGNCLELLELYHVAAKTGLVVVPLSPLLRGDGLVNLVRDAEPSVLVTSSKLMSHVEEVGERIGVEPSRVLLAEDSYRALTQQASAEEPPPAGVTDDDPFNVVYSSGTTGEPKGIVHTHGIRLAYATGFAGSFRIHPESIVLHAGSLVFNGAFLTLMPAMYLGCTYVLMPAFDPHEMLATMSRESVTHVMAVPTQIVALLQDPDFDGEHLPHLEMLGTVGAPLLLEHKQEVIRRLPRRFYELYGITEGLITILDRDDAARKTASVGVPPPLYDMRIVDESGGEVPRGAVGEITGRGPITMPGYFRRPDLTAAVLRNGWLYSGDLGFLDEDGFLHLVDRKKDMIISGGVNVYPRDIEEVAIRHPAVLDVAVFGVADERWGEAPVAAVRLRDEESVSADELRDWINERLQARYQRLREVVLCDSFPTSAAGKTLRRALRDEYLGRADVASAP